jgi:hypothetical protein
MVVAGAWQRFSRYSGKVRGLATSNNVATFEEYCEQRWEMTDRHARYLIRAAAFAQQLYVDMAFLGLLWLAVEPNISKGR